MSTKFTVVSKPPRVTPKPVEGKQGFYHAHLSFRFVDEAGNDCQTRKRPLVEVEAETAEIAKALITGEWLKLKEFYENEIEDIRTEVPIRVKPQPVVEVQPAKEQKPIAVEATGIVFSKLVDEWWADEAAQALYSPSSLPSYQSTIRNHLLPRYGNKWLDSITEKDILEFLDYLKKPERRYKKGVAVGYSENTIYNHFTVFQALMRYALDKKYIAFTPFQELTTKQGNKEGQKKRPKKKKVDTAIWSEDEVKGFVQDLLSLDESQFHYTVFYMIAVGMGLRRSEILALSWEEIDLVEKAYTKSYQKKAQIRVEYTLLKNINGELVRVHKRKCGEDPYDADIPPRVVEVLKRYREYQNPVSDRQLLFTHMEGRYKGKVFHPDTMSTKFKKLVAQMGYSPIRLHDARHTVASLLYYNSKDIKLVQKTLGHQTPTFTIDRYVKSLNSAADYMTDIMG